MRDEKQKTKTYRQVALLIKSMNQLFFNLKEDPIKDDQTIQMLFQNLKDYHISFIVVLHHNEILLPLVQRIIKQLKIENSKKLEDLLRLVYRLGYKCLILINEKYLKIFKQFKLKYNQEDKEEYRELSQANKNRYQVLLELLLHFFSIKKSKQQSIPQLQKIQNFIYEELKPIIPQNLYQESFLGWLKAQASSFQKQIYDRLRIVTNSLCCRFHFLNNETIEYSQTINTKFMPQGAKKFEYKERRQFLKRVIISYLNDFGGTIYFGIDYNLKKTTIVGVPISKTQRQNFMSFLVEQLIFNIYPYQIDLEKDDDQGMKSYRLKKLQNLQNLWQKGVQNQYILTQQISVEFINIHQNQTLIYSRNQLDETLYIVKINIKPGDQYRLYHLINEKDTPQAYLVEGKKEKTLSFKEYYEQMYRRLKAKANNRRYDKGKSPIHQYCRSFRSIKQKKRQQVKQRE